MTPPPRVCVTNLPLAQIFPITSLQCVTVKYIIWNLHIYWNLYYFVCIQICLDAFSELGVPHQRACFVFFQKQVFLYFWTCKFWKVYQHYIMQCLWLWGLVENGCTPTSRSLMASLLVNKMMNWIDALTFTVTQIFPVPPPHPVCDHHFWHTRRPSGAPLPGV